jgi:hypothetical protein
VPVIEALLQEVDRAWRQPGPRIPLRIIGSTALMLQTSYDRGTKDSDVLETDEVTDQIAGRLIEIAGPNTVIHRRHGMYVDIVRRGIPFRRQSPVYLPLEQLNTKLMHFEVFAMSVVDVVIGKLARFNASDRSDIDAMVERDLIAHRDVVSCFREAIDFKMDLMAGEFTEYVRHVHTVERDMFDVAETEFDEPSWLR